MVPIELVLQTRLALFKLGQPLNVLLGLDKLVPPITDGTLIKVVQPLNILFVIVTLGVDHSGKVVKLTQLVHILLVLVTLETVEIVGILFNK